MPIPKGKGFDPSLFDCIDKAISSTIGREAASTFYYHIREKHGLSESDFSKKPLEVLQYLKEMLGELGFEVLKKPIISEIKQTFEITENVVDLTRAFELAKRNYLQKSM